VRRRVAPELDDEHPLRLGVVRADLVEQAAELGEAIAPAGEVPDRLVPPPGDRVERAGVRERHAASGGAP
jgi:hypothetical protein